MPSCICPKTGSAEHGTYKGQLTYPDCMIGITLKLCHVIHYGPENESSSGINLHVNKQ
jgi:hypothetical protein